MLLLGLALAAPGPSRGQDVPPIEPPTRVILPDEDDPMSHRPSLEPLPDRPPVREPLPAGEEPPPVYRLERAPVIPGSQRQVSIFPRLNAPGSLFRTLPTTEDGTDILVITGGRDDHRRVVRPVRHDRRLGRITRSSGPAAAPGRAGRRAAKLVQDADQPMEVYLEGNVVFRQDERKVAGNGDQRRSSRPAASTWTCADQRFVGPRRPSYGKFAARLHRADAEPRAIGSSSSRPSSGGPDGTALLRARRRSRPTRRSPPAAASPSPGYRFHSRTVDLTEQPPEPLIDPRTGTAGRPPGRPGGPAGRPLSDRRPPELLLPRARAGLLLAPAP